MNSKLLAILLLFFVSSAGYSEEAIKAQPALQPLQDPNLKVFSDAAITAGLGDLFKGTGPFTVFAPSNQAFEKFGRAKLEELLKPENRDRLITLIIYHVVPGEYFARDLKTINLQSIQGKSLTIKVENGEIWINGAKVTRKDLEGPNGVVHEIDAVLIP